MPFAIFAQLLEGRETDVAGARGEFDVCEGVPKVFAEGCRDGFLAVEGELGEGCVVLFVSLADQFVVQCIKEMSRKHCKDCKELKGEDGEREGREKEGTIHS